MRGELPGEIDATGVYSALFDASADALLLVDTSGRIVLCNPTAGSLLGYAVEELTGLRIEVLVPDSIRPRHAEFREAYGRQPRPRPMGTQTGLVARRKDGSEVLVEIALSPLQVQGQPFTMAAVRDVSSYPRVREALQRARYGEHLAQLGRQAVDSRDPQTLLDSVPRITAEAMEVDAVLVLLLEDDRSALRVAAALGTGPGELPGERLVLPIACLAGRVLADGQTLVVDDATSEAALPVPPQMTQAGLRSAMAVPVSDRGRTVGALVVRSRHATRFGDEERRFVGSVATLLATSLQRSRTEEQLSHAQRLESVGQLTGGIAHDFNNLLTVIQGNLQVLEELPAIADDATASQWVAAATRAARRGAELTAKLLAFARRQVLQPQAVDVAAMLDSLSGMLQRTLDQRIAISVVHDERCPPVRADPGQLESALLNIAINARDAMRDGGKLVFSCHMAHALPADLVGGDDGEDGGADGGPWVAIAVSDTGCGMSDEVRERAFEPFFTTKDAGRGTGLGLATVYGFVKQSKGAVGIRSAPGQGTTVTLYIPHAGPQRSAGAATGGADAAVPPGLRVLLVEDDAEVRQVVELALRALGCASTCASSGEEALSLLDQGRQVDLLVSDIALGAGMRGLELARRAQERLPQLAVVLMSGFSEELLDADREAPPNWELLPKPFSREALARAAARAVGELRAADAG